jgi:hypothetical protein
MRAAEGTSPHTASWFVEPDRVAAHRRRHGCAGRRHEATSGRAVVVSSVFLVLFTVALMVGGQAAIDPLMRMVAAGHDTAIVGDVVFPMPDGQYCRHMSFDNATSEMIEGTIEHCPDKAVGAAGRRTGRGFTWGEH